MSKNKDKELDDIFANDPFNLLDAKPKSSSVRTEDERLASSFQEINDFIAKNEREPEPNTKNISEFQLYSRLKGIRENEEKSVVLEPRDTYGLLKKERKKIESVDDILNDDSLDILEDDSDELFNLKHVPKHDERAAAGRHPADFIARRKPYQDFDKYEPLFKEIQSDLASAQRKLVPFRQENLRAGEFYVHSGILLLLKSVDFEEEVQEFKSGKRIRKDGRTHCIFDNGTESNMLYRSLYKALLENGKAITKNARKVNIEFTEKFDSITEEDEEAGYIYVLRSKSTNEQIASISNLYKIGYTKVDVPKRIQDAELEPTFLMAPVSIVSVFKCYNMKPRKLEQLLHNFFGSSCLNVDVFDSRGKRYTPREWFIAPLEVIEQAIQLMLSGDVVSYRYDADSESIISK